MAIQHPQHDLPLDLLSSRLRGASSIWDENSGALLLEDFFSLPSALGSLSSQEVGADVLASSGTVSVTGTLSGIESEDFFTGTANLGAVYGLGVLPFGAFALGTGIETAREVIIPPGVTGSLAVSEVGVDVLASSGIVFVAGTLVVSEVGADVLASSGIVSVTGTLTASEIGADVLASLGMVSVTGSLVVSETGTDILSSSGTVSVTGTLIVSEVGTDVLSSSGNVVVTGSMPGVEIGIDTLSASGNVIVAGSMSATETDIDTLLVSGNVIVTGSFTAVETTIDAFTAAGIVKQFIQGTFTASELNEDSATILGRILIQGIIDATDEPDIAEIHGGLLVFGTLSATELDIDYFGIRYTEIFLSSDGCTFCFLVVAGALNCSLSSTSTMGIVDSTNGCRNVIGQATGSSLLSLDSCGCIDTVLNSKSTKEINLTARCEVKVYTK